MTLHAGTHVVLTKNLDISLGLTNGSSGTVVGFAYPHGHEPYIGEDVDVAATCNEMPIIALVQFPTFRGTNSFSQILCEPLGDLVVPIHATRGPSIRGLVRFQLPLRPAHALTSHGVQGYTARQGVIYVPHAVPSDLNIAYVAFSRATRLSHIHIVSHISHKHFRAKPSQRIAIDDEGQQ